MSQIVWVLVFAGLIVWLAVETTRNRRPALPERATIPSVVAVPVMCAVVTAAVVVAVLAVT